MKQWIDIQNNDITLEGMFCEMLNYKTNEMSYDFEYNGLPLSMTCKLETRTEEP